MALVALTQADAPHRIVVRSQCAPDASFAFLSHNKANLLSQRCVSSGGKHVWPVVIASGSGSIAAVGVVTRLSAACFYPFDQTLGNICWL